MVLPLVALITAPITQAPVAGSPSSLASDADPGGPSIEQRIAQSANVGRLLFAFDRAAWVSSDALTAAVSKDRLIGAGGYVVEPGDAGILRVTYYRGAAADARAFFVADVYGGKVVHQELLAQPVALTQRQSVFARAREVAADRARERAYRPCTSAPFNTVVLPSRNDGPVAVYLLTAQQDSAIYPMGGNYRVIVAPDGKVLASRPYSVGCLNTPLPKLPPGAKPVGLEVNHLLDPVPTEIHVFASYSLHMPVFVATPDRRIWQVQGDKITPFGAK